MAKRIGKQSIWVQRRVRVDRLSDEVAAEAGWREIKGCVILPRQASGTQGNENDKGWTIAEGHVVILPFGSDVLADDMVRVKEGGESWEVDGLPGEYVNKRGKGKAIILQLKRVGT